MHTIKKQAVYHLGDPSVRGTFWFYVADMRKWAVVEMDVNRSRMVDSLVIVKGDYGGLGGKSYGEHDDTFLCEPFHVGRLIGSGDVEPAAMTSRIMAMFRADGVVDICSELTIESITQLMQNLQNIKA